MMHFRVVRSLIATVVTAAVMTMTITPANAESKVAAPAVQAPVSAQASAPEQGAAFERQVEVLTKKMDRAAEELEVGESRRIVVAQTDITLTKAEDGRLAIEPNSNGEGADVMPMGICTQAAVAAVYAIGAVGAAALAATGGGAVLGVFIGPAVWNALSIALAGGSGVQTLVSVYIC